MAKSILQVSPNLMVKIHPHEGNEYIIGFVKALNFGVSQGQKPQFTVDSPFPETIDQAASPSMVTGSMTLYVPKDSNMENLGLVPSRKDQKGDTWMGQARFFNMKIYDRQQNKLLYTITQCKIGQYSMSIAARSVVMISASFQAVHLEQA